MKKKKLGIKMKIAWKFKDEHVVFALILSKKKKRRRKESVCLNFVWQKGSKTLRVDFILGLFSVWRGIYASILKNFWLKRRVCLNLVWQNDSKTLKRQEWTSFCFWFV